MYINNLITNVLTLENLSEQQKTRVTYTAASGLPDWEDVITGELTDSSIPNIKNIETVSIGNSVTSIKNAAFSDCSSLKNITIPDTVINFENAAFKNCSSLTSVTIPASVTVLGSAVFTGCSSLTSVTVKGSLTHILSDAFWNCTNCLLFDFRNSTSIPDLPYKGAFGNTPSNKEIIVPDSLYDSWIAARNWNSTSYNIVNCIVKASQSSLGSL